MLPRSALRRRRSPRPLRCEAYVLTQPWVTPSLGGRTITDQQNYPHQAGNVTTDNSGLDPSAATRYWRAIATVSRSSAVMRLLYIRDRQDVTPPAPRTASQPHRLMGRTACSRWALWANQPCRTSLAELTTKPSSVFATVSA